jgi:hypothetical protein
LGSDFGIALYWTFQPTADDELLLSVLPDDNESLASVLPDEELLVSLSLLKNKELYL